VVLNSKDSWGKNRDVSYVTPGCLCTPTSFITERSFRGLSWRSGRSRFEITAYIPSDLGDLDLGDFEGASGPMGYGISQGFKV